MIGFVRFFGFRIGWTFPIINGIAACVDWNVHVLGEHYVFQACGASKPAG